MDRAPRRRAAGTGPSRSGAGARSGVGGSGSSRAARTIVPRAPDDAAPDRSDRPVVRQRAAGSRPGTGRPRTAPPATTGGRRLGQLSARGASASKSVRTKSQLIKQVAVLGLVFCAVAFALAVPLRNYLTQRAALGATVSQEQQLRVELAGLVQQKAALSDPAYVAAEAKRRLQMVKPGDTVYVVHAPPLPGTRQPAATRATPAVPWYSPLWDTLSDPVASSPAAGPAAPKPAATKAAAPKPAVTGSAATESGASERGNGGATSTSRAGAGR